MAVKTSESPSLLVFNVFAELPNTLLSVSEIVAILFEKYDVRMDRHTVADHVRNLQLLKNPIFQKLDRTGPKNVPVYKFILLKNPITQCYSEIC